MKVDSTFIDFALGCVDEFTPVVDDLVANATRRPSTRVAQGSNDEVKVIERFADGFGEGAHFTRQRRAAVPENTW